MCIHRIIIRSFLTVLLLTAASLRAQAVQYAYTTYALGESAFSAGLTPPPGIYVSTVIGTYDGKLAGTADFGGVTINAGAKAVPTRRKQRPAFEDEVLAARVAGSPNALYTVW